MGLSCFRDKAVIEGDVLNDRTKLNRVYSTDQTLEINIRLCTDLLGCPSGRLDSYIRDSITLLHVFLIF